MKIKKSFSMILSTVMVLSMAGCGKTLPSSDISSLLSSGESTSSGESAQELVPEEGASLLFRANSGELAFGQAVAEKFKEKYGVEVTVEEGTGLDDYQKIVLEGPSGTGPDVFMLSHDYAAEGQQAGLFLELDSKIANKLKDKVNPVAMKTVTLGEQVFGVPVSIETSVLFYNKQLVTGDPASSFEQLLEESESFNDSAENKFWFLDDIVSGGSAMYPMLSAYGWNLFGEDGTDENNPGFDTPEFVKNTDGRIDNNWYVTHQIIPPLERIFECIGISILTGKKLEKESSLFEFSETECQECQKPKTILTPKKNKTGLFAFT